MRLQGKHIAILGGTSGIGLAVARAALAEGASVQIVSGRTGSIARARDTLPTSALTAQVVDMRSEAAIKGYFESAGTFDHVV